MQDIPSFVRGPSPIPQWGGSKELLPPIELNDRRDLEGFGRNATNFFDYACHKYPWPYDSVQRCDFAPAQTTCEGLGITSDSSESDFPCEDEMQPIGRQSSFDSNIGYPGVTLESAVDRFQVVFPRRRLSYGEHLQTPESKSLHRIAGFRGLSHTIGCLTIDDDYGKSSTDRPQHTDERPVPPRSKPRLRIDTFATSERRQTPKSKPDRMEAPSSQPTLWVAPDHNDQIGDAYWSEQAQEEGKVNHAVSFTEVDGDRTYKPVCTDSWAAYSHCEQPRQPINDHSYRSKLQVFLENIDSGSTAKACISLQPIHATRNAAFFAKAETEARCRQRSTLLSDHPTKLTPCNPTKQRFFATYARSII